MAETSCLLNSRAVYCRTEGSNPSLSANYYGSCLKAVLLLSVFADMEFEDFMAIPVKTFKDYPASRKAIKRLHFFIKILSQLNLLLKITYRKYFHFSE